MRRGLIPAHAGKTARRRSALTPPWAHPRSRGENGHLARGRVAGQGSSPLTRGKLRRGRPTPASPRLIPAHAGKTRGYRSHWISWGGSSPLTRGKRPQLHARSLRRRLIPAHAGKTASAWGTGTRGPAHPRSRGENRIDNDGVSIRAGSSPLTRGKPETTLDNLYLAGLIPAHAGKTRRHAQALTRRRAHPRSRGENANFLGGVVSSPGSSPLTRGKLGRNRDGRVISRLIPAHAGKTAIETSMSPSSSAHPRSRGENDLARPADDRAEGSSPLTRGKQNIRNVNGQEGGLIPAHAGKTRCSQTSRGTCTAHPRSRGENAVTLKVAREVAGSSPLTRGKPHSRM